ncbi:MAG: helix-turn-helix domain-containing protein [Akkermansiaceae bacterium]|nr:helix-turn-helix domain-containing protein [Akkermansiaceae bacterium]MCF7730447.1 helix-turn-helix domain-containing protein [Akkermansiaceae bacterium]
MNKNITRGNTYLPDSVSPPGDTLEDVLDDRGMSQAELAERTGLSRKTINLIVNGKAPLSQESALLFEKALGIPAGFWISREKDYREFLARAAAGRRQAAYAGWAKTLPYAAMVKQRWIEPASSPAEKIDRLLAFFGVANPESWHELYARPQAAFRRSEKFGKKTEIISAWLRQGEILADKTRTPAYSEAKFIETLAEIRKLCIAEDPNDFLPRLQSLCAGAGVLFLLVPELPSLGVSGVTRWLGERPLIQQCLRFKTNDHFWLTFFHEAKHVLQSRRRHVFIEATGLPEEDIEHEEDANRFAAGTLIPEKAYRGLVENEPGSAAIRAFARRIGVHPGIVVGRLQRDKILAYGHPAGALKVKFEWAKPSQS